MSDSEIPEALAAKHERDHERRVEAIKRWISYIESEPPETWGPQQNAVVNGQLEAAQSVETSAAHKQRVKDIADDILAEQDSSDEASE